MLFRSRKNIIFALRIRSELPESTALPFEGGRGIFVVNHAVNMPPPRGFAGLA
ncbi:Uncharacterized protein dnm_043740 [Desulfonema magnum]|uniref:Uncharacterized protein n=1 Tax=Desulfonema magnum TaxID=45655 RepID=A0A975GNU6_9BACT|nr:Uncharacterized protein dnm_043740 [Desulfonema magnum]